MAKEAKGFIKLQIPAGKANPSPPVGPALGQRGLNIMDFCKEFNKRTEKMEAGMPVPVVITYYSDKTFSFVTKLPPVSFYIKKTAKLQKGSTEPGKKVVGRIKMSQIREIAEVKMPDLNAVDIEGAANMIKGTATSMGLEVIED